MWNDVIDIIKNNQRFVVTSHVHPDGDAIGSEIALASFLEDQGKTVRIVNSSPTPAASAFLDPTGRIEIYPAGVGADVLDDVDAVFIVDVNSWGQLGEIGDALKGSAVPRVCIDHHQGIDDGFASVHVGDTSAAATGVLIYELIGAMAGDVTPTIADALFTTIATDTGGFRFANTDERALQVAGALCGAGAKPFAIHRRAFSKKRATVKLLGAVLSTLDTANDGRIAWIYADRDMFTAAGAEYEDSDGLLDVVRAIDDVEYCLFFKEVPDGRIKVSLRSNGNVDVHKIASHFEGGGHKMASGMTVDGPMDAAIEKVIAEARSNFPLDS